MALLGDASVGKTALCLRLLKNVFTSTRPTLGVDTVALKFATECCNVQLTVYDTAGMERYHATALTYIRQCEYAGIVYALNDARSAQHVEEWV